MWKGRMEDDSQVWATWKDKLPLSEMENMTMGEAGLEEDQEFSSGHIWDAFLDIQVQRDIKQAIKFASLNFGSSLGWR